MDASVKGFIPDNQFVADQSHPEFIPDHAFTADEDKYSTTGQQIKTGLEGAAQGVAGPLATLAETKLLGVKPEDIRGRAEANPITHGVGEAAGFVGGALIPGVGEYSLASKIGEAGAAASSIIHGSEVARAAVRAASEMALVQASDETSKWLQSDPNQSIQSAIANIGLSAALGGVGGAAFSKAGSAIKSLIGVGGEPAAEGIAKGFKLNMDPLRANEPLFLYNSLPEKAAIESEGVGDKVAQAIKDHAANGGLEIAGGGIGVALGHATGIPGAGWIGAYIGKEHLAPILKSIIPAIGAKLATMDISGPGMIAAVNAAEQAIKGRMLLEKAANSVFSGGFDIKPADKDQLKMLDTKIQTLHNDPVAATSAINGNLEHYMPDHAMSMGQTVGNTVNYLNMQKPSLEKNSPLDSKPIPSSISKENYMQALSIAQEPLSVMNNIKKGTLKSTDIQHLASMYPALYNQMKASLMNNMADHLSKNNTIPYKTRLGLSLFMGQPLDSSMSPQSIMASQPQPQQIPQGAPGVKNTKHSTQNLDKMASMDATPMQAREAHKITKG